MGNRKVALVTGGSSGIGMGIALELAGKGYDIAFTYRNNAEGPRAAVEDLESCAALVDRVHADFGRIDAMVCNAASDRRFSILTAKPENYLYMTSQLYSAQMLLAGAAARHMVKSGIHGGILFITSIHGQMITTNDFLYGGMKAAIERSCKSLALELSPYRIRVNCIAPGAINVRHQDDAQRKYPYFTMVPLGRGGRYWARRGVPALRRGGLYHRRNAARRRRIRAARRARRLGGTASGGYAFCASRL